MSAQSVWVEYEVKTETRTIGIHPKSKARIEGAWTWQRTQDGSACLRVRDGETPKSVLSRRIGERLGDTMRKEVTILSVEEMP